MKGLNSENSTCLSHAEAVAWTDDTLVDLSTPQVVDMTSRGATRIDELLTWTDDQAIDLSTPKALDLTARRAKAARGPQVMKRQAADDRAKLTVGELRHTLSGPWCASSTADSETKPQGDIGCNSAVSSLCSTPTPTSPFSSSSPSSSPSSSSCRAMPTGEEGGTREGDFSPHSLQDCVAERGECRAVSGGLVFPGALSTALLGEDLDVEDMNVDSMPALTAPAFHREGLSFNFSHAFSSPPSLSLARDPLLCSYSAGGRGRGSGGGRESDGEGSVTGVLEDMAFLEDLLERIGDYDDGHSVFPATPLSRQHRDGTSPPAAASTPGSPMTSTPGSPMSSTPGSPMTSTPGSPMTSTPGSPITQPLQLDLSMSVSLSCPLGSPPASGKSVSSLMSREEQNGQHTLLGRLLGRAVSPGSTVSCLAESCPHPCPPPPRPPSGGASQAYPPCPSSHSVRGTRLLAVHSARDRRTRRAAAKHSVRDAGMAGRRWVVDDKKRGVRSRDPDRSRSLPGRNSERKGEEQWQRILDAEEEEEEEVVRDSEEEEGDTEEKEDEERGDRAKQDVAPALPDELLDFAMQYSQSLAVGRQPSAREVRAVDTAVDVVRVTASRGPTATAVCVPRSVLDNTVNNLSVHVSDNASDCMAANTEVSISASVSDSASSSVSHSASTSVSDSASTSASTSVSDSASTSVSTSVSSSSADPLHMDRRDMKPLSPQRSQELKELHKALSSSSSVRHISSSCPLTPASSCPLTPASSCPLTPASSCAGLQSSVISSSTGRDVMPPVMSITLEGVGGRGEVKRVILRPVERHRAALLVKPPSKVSAGLLSTSDLVSTPHLLSTSDHLWTSLLSPALTDHMYSSPDLSSGARATLNCRVSTNPSPNNVRCPSPCVQRLAGKGQPAEPRHAADRLPPHSVLSPSPSPSPSASPSPSSTSHSEAPRAKRVCVGLDRGARERERGEKGQTVLQCLVGSIPLPARTLPPPTPSPTPSPASSLGSPSRGDSTSPAGSSPSPPSSPCFPPVPANGGGKPLGAMSELEKHLRGLMAPPDQRHNEAEDTLTSLGSRSFLELLLTGELSRERYRQIDYQLLYQERERRLTQSRLAS